MSMALLFPGQGAQHAQMLPWLDDEPHASATLARLCAVVGPDWRARLHDTTWRSENRIAQPLLTAIGIAAWQCLAHRLPAPAMVAGYSVGELAAFASAGVFDAATAITLAIDRALLMSDSVRGSDTGLLAVQGHGARALAEARADVAVAIRITGDRMVVGGASSALDVACTEWMAAGLRCTRLPVQLASHTPWMASAATAFALRLSSVPLRAPQAAVACNADGAATRDPRALERALSAQIASPVRWDECMDTIAERRIRCVLEVGPGATLASMWRERHPEIPVRSTDEFRSPDAITRWVAQSVA